jgi:hypothetical protein
MTTSEKICAEIHRSLEPLPTFKDSAKVPFDNGLDRSRARTRKLK